MIYINSKISIDEKDIRFHFVRASGPGGQNVNKVASAVQLRIDLKNTSCLPDDVYERLKMKAGRRITENGILLIDARCFRSQDKNRQDAVNRLVDLIRSAAVKPKVRRKTKPSVAIRKRILETKRHRSKIKKMRKRVETVFCIVTFFNYIIIT